MVEQDDIFSLHASLRERTREVEMSLAEYLSACREDPLCYASLAEQMLRAIGEPELVDTSRDPRPSQLFPNRIVRIDPAFPEFHVMEDTIERIVGSFRHTAQGLAVALATIERGENNNKDISTLVGKVDIRKLDILSQNDRDARSFARRSNRANQRILEFVEMFKAPIKTLAPLLAITPIGNCLCTGNIGVIPFGGIVRALSNEAEGQSFGRSRSRNPVAPIGCLDQGLGARGPPTKV